MIRPILSAAFGAFASLALVVACSGTDNGSEAPSQFVDSGIGDTGTFDPGDPNAPPLITGDGGAGQAPATNTPEYACFKSSTIKPCRTCCENLHPAGLKVFNDAMDRCVCQPSKCGDTCATSYCGSPRIKPTNACASCANAASKALDGGGTTSPSDASVKTDSGSAFPEQGIQDCLGYASAACAANADCLAVAQCKLDSQCASKPTSDPGPDH